MKNLLSLLFTFTTIVNATNYEPHSYTFNCPSDQHVDLTQPILVGVGVIPKMIGQCWWIKPTTSFSLLNNGKTIIGHTIWILDGPILNSGCGEVKDETIVTNGVITNVSCSYTANSF
ncbi:MAG: hypothetical protein K2P99_01730 [Burkholderiales bacterium]|nr:hypothetical protein [Burkholderiales bacterium]